MANAKPTDEEVERGAAVLQRALAGALFLTHQEFQAMARALLRAERAGRIRPRKKVKK